MEQGTACGRIAAATPARRDWGRGDSKKRGADDRTTLPGPRRFGEQLLRVKSQWAWSGFTTHESEALPIMAGTTALLDNCGPSFCACEYRASTLRQ